MIKFILNDILIETDQPAGMTLLDFIRYHQHLVGTKIGCREGDCGACTILVGKTDQGGKISYESMTSCLMPLGNAAGKHIVTIEGINFPDRLNIVQEAMADAGATQCGFCTPGFVMSLAGFCLSDIKHTPKNAIASVDGNICRCTGYKSIERAATSISEQMKSNKETVFPSYFNDISKRLIEIKISSADSRLTTNDSRLALGGGTDLYVQKQEEMVHADIEFLFDQKKGIRKEGDVCHIGASVTVTELKNDPVINEIFPAFQTYSKLVSSTPIRNMATIAGNFVNASPIGDLTIFFLALDTQIILNDGNKKRELSLRKFYKGYKQLDKLPEEQIESLWFKIPASLKFNFEKVSKRTHLDIASVNTAISLEMEGAIIKKAGISAGGVGPTPLFLPKSSAFAEGKKLSPELAEKVIAIAKTEISPISDARGSKEYKSLLLGQLIKAHFIAVI